VNTILKKKDVVSVALHTFVFLCIIAPDQSWIFGLCSSLQFSDHNSAYFVKIDPVFGVVFLDL
jgi:hypothetical protein